MAYLLLTFYCLNNLAPLKSLFLSSLSCLSFSLSVSLSLTLSLSSLPTLSFFTSSYPYTLSLLPFTLLSPSLSPLPLPPQGTPSPFSLSTGQYSLRQPQAMAGMARLRVPKGASGFNSLRAGKLTTVWL